MSKNAIPEADKALWRNYVDAEHKFISTRMKLFKESRSLVELIRAGLSNPIERTAAINVAGQLGLEQLQQLFNELLELASFSHGQTANIHRLILSLPHDWLLSNIEAYAEPILRNGTYEEYRGFLTLYNQIDNGLTSIARFMKIKL